MKKITLNKETDEIVNYNNSYPETFKSERVLSEFEHTLGKIFHVHCNIYQEETNARLTSEKSFDNLDSAKKYAHKFIAENPISDVLLYSTEKIDYMIYEER